MRPRLDTLRVRARIAWWLALFALLLTIAPLPIAAAPMRWEAYGHGTEGEYFAWWCSQNIVQTTEPFTGQPLILEPWQLEFMGEALAVDANLRQCWKSVALVVSRKNGKTAMLAAYALYHLLTSEGNPEILLAAASDKNARRLFDAVVRYARANPMLEQLVHIREYTGEIVRRDGLGTIFRLAGDATTLHGYNPSLVICDELHAWTKPSHGKVWSALTTAGGARTQTQVFTITTAGEAAQRQTSILGRMVDANEEVGECEVLPGLTISRNVAGQTIIYNYSAIAQTGEAATDRWDVEALKLANPASWITADGYLARQAAAVADLTNAEVLQFHGCVWAVGETTWVDPQAFARLASPRDRPDRDTAVVLAFDGSYSRDSTVLIGATVEAIPYLWVEAAWERPPDANSKWRVSRLDAMASIEDAMERYDVVEFAPDPPGWHSEIEQLEAKYGEVVVRFETDQPRRIGPAADAFKQAVLGPGGDDAELEAADLLDDDTLRDRVHAALAGHDLDDLLPGGLTHSGDEILTRHLSNCVPIRRGGYLVPSKEANDSPRKIDAAIGCLIAYYRAQWHYTTQSDDLGAIVVETGPKRKRRPGHGSQR